MRLTPDERKRLDAVLAEVDANILAARLEQEQADANRAQIAKQMATHDATIARYRQKKKGATS